MNAVVDRVALALWEADHPRKGLLCRPDIEGYQERAQIAIIGSPCDEDYFVWYMIWELFDICDNDKAFLQTVLDVKAERDRVIRKNAEPHSHENQ